MTWIALNKKQLRFLAKGELERLMTKTKTSPRDFLTKLGAVRPMAPAGVDVLVLGDFHEGHYPIKWTKAAYQRYQDEWLVFGIETKEPLTEEDCKRILSAAGDR